MAVTINELSIRGDNRRVIKVTRAALSKLELKRARGHQLRALGKGMDEALRTGTNALLAPYAPAGLALIPATLAWGAVAAPFCILGDLVSKAAGEQRIKIL